MGQNSGMRSYFRSAYLWRFGKDITQGALDDDIEEFIRSATVPSYLCLYIASNPAHGSNVGSVLAAKAAA